jgi:hypothetical protein
MRPIVEKSTVEDAEGENSPSFLAAPAVQKWLKKSTLSLQKVNPTPPHCLSNVCSSFYVMKTNG